MIFTLQMTSLAFFAIISQSWDSNSVLMASVVTVGTDTIGFSGRQGPTGGAFWTILIYISKFHHGLSFTQPFQTRCPQNGHTIKHFKLLPKWGLKLFKGSSFLVIIYLKKINNNTTYRCVRQLSSKWQPVEVRHLVNLTAVLARYVVDTHFRWRYFSG